MHKRILTVLAAALTALTATAEFSYKAELTVSGYSGETTLNNFPVLVRLSPARIDGFTYTRCQADGKDIQFTSPDGATVYPHEIDTWNPDGESLVWVNVPQLSGTETKMAFWFGDGSIIVKPATKPVWASASGNKYMGVWHMSEEATEETAASVKSLDSAEAITADWMDGTPTAGSGTAGKTGDVTQMISVEGAIGNGRQNWTEPTYLYGNGLVANSYGSAYGSVDPITISGWFKHADTAYYWDHMFYKRKKSDNSSSPADAFAIEVNVGSGKTPNPRPRGSSGSGSDVTLGTNLISDWGHVTFAFDGKKCHVYVNGELKGDSSIAACKDNDSPLVFGNNCDVASGNVGDAAWNGWIDEVRYLKGTKSAEWIAAEYAAMTSDSFLLAGTVQSAMPVMGEVSVAPEGRKAVLSGAIASVGMGAMACDVYLSLGLSADHLGTATKVASGVTDSFAYTISGLTPKTAYCYELFVTNNATVARGTKLTGSFTTGTVFDYRRKVTFTVGYDAEDADALSGIPVLVKLSAGNPVGFRYSDCAAGGSDIRFVDANGAAVPFEIDTWNPAGESLVWVKAPAVTNGTAFTMYFKGTPKGSPCEEYEPMMVWTDYTGVWHLNDLAADATEYSQGLYSNATATADIDAHLSTHSIPNETGKFGKAFRVNDSTGKKQGNFNEGGAWVVDAGTDSPIDSDGGKLTVSCWVKHNDWGNAGGEKIIYKRMDSDNNVSPANAFAVEAQSKYYDFAFTAKASSKDRARDETTDKDPDPRANWVYVTAVFDSSNTILLYVNAEHRGGKNYIAGVTDNDAPLVFGNNVSIASGATGDNAWNGWIDEVRYVKGAKSAAWIAAEYAAMTDDTFLTAGEVEKLNPPGLMLLVR